MTNTDTQHYRECLNCKNILFVFPERDKRLHAKGYPTTGHLECDLEDMHANTPCPHFVQKPEGYKGNCIYRD